MWSPLNNPDAASSGRAIGSLEEWLALGEDEPGEFVKGMLEEEEMPDAVHELTVSWLIGVFTSWLGDEGFVFGSELKLAMGTTGRKGDVVVLLPHSPAPAQRGPPSTPPDIVVEVITPTPRDERRDRVEKMTEYAAFGVRFYWLIDPALGTFEIFELDDHHRYAKVVGQASGAVDPVPGCTGLRIDLDGLWARLRRLSPA